jgi:site-specific recombinase XerD
MKSPLPIFDNIKHIDEVDLAKTLSKSNDEILRDYTHALAFLKAYKGSQGTFNSYRRETERLLHWCTFVAEKPLNQLKREDIEILFIFVKNPSNPGLVQQRFLVSLQLRELVLQIHSGVPL